MATAYLKSVSRGTHKDPATLAVIDDEHLHVIVITDEYQEAAFNLFFADEAGLETEWDAGTATTVLEASIDSWIAANMETADDGLTGDQRDGKEGYDYVVT